MSTTQFAGDAPTMSQGAAAWSALCDALRQRAKLDAQIVELTGRVQRSGTIEALEGVTLDTALNLVHRLPAADRAVQLTAADVLVDMPATRQLFASGALSWGQVRGIVAEARRLDKADRGVLDQSIAASEDRFGKWDPDDAVDAVRVRASELRDRSAAQRSEDAQARGNFLWAQPGMFGRGKVYGELDNPSLATVVGRIDAEAPGDDGRSLAQRRADGLVAMALHRCVDTAGDGTAGEGCDAGNIGAATGADTGADGGGGVMRMTRHRRIDWAIPAFAVVVDTRDVSVNAAGVIQLNAPGCLPTLTARTVEALAADATVRVVLVEGGRPLAVTRKVQARDVPEDVRFAVKVRDGGDRFPGSRRRVEHLHHLDKRGRGHHPDAIVGLAGTSHRRTHTWGWSISIDPETGETTFTRGERSWTTLPKHTRLRRPPPRPPEDTG